MKIEPKVDTKPITDAPVRAGHTHSHKPATSATSSVGNVADSADISAAGSGIASSSGDFDQTKVDAISKAIRDGKFTVNPDAIADRLIADATALLGPRA